MTMATLDERDKPQDTSPPVLAINWHTISVWVFLLILAVAIVLAVGCSPLSDPGKGSMGVRPEDSLVTLPPATVKIDQGLSTVCTSTKVIKSEVAGMVPSVREVATVAPAPAARIAQGHEAIYQAASTAEAAALEAQDEVRVVQAGTAAADAALVQLREDHQREVKALGQQVEAQKQEVVRLQNEANGFLQTLFRWGMILGGLAIAAGVGLFFAHMGTAIPLSVVSFGVTLLALSALLQRIAGWIVPVAGGLAGMAVIVAVVLGIRHWQAVSKAGVNHADAIKNSVRDAVKTDGLAATHVAEALKAVKDDAIKNQPESVQREVWNIRAF